MNIYISPAIASVVRICIDEYKNFDWKGRIYTRLNKEAICFEKMDEAITLLGNFWNVIGFPQESTISRTFTKQQEMSNAERELFRIEYPKDGTRDKIRVELSEADMEKKRGDQGTFIVRIKYRQNATWQGNVTWVEENKTVQFRSALELIKLLDSTQEKNTDEWDE